MGVAIRIEPDTGIAIATCTGILALEDAQDGVAALWNKTGWLGRSAVWDFREAQFDVSTSETRAVAQFVLHHQPDTPPSKVAFVTGRDVDYGMARMFGAFREDPRTTFRVFRDYEEAIGWARLVEPGST